MSSVRADDRDRDDDGKFQVVPRTYDPADTDLAQAAWLSGIGCPTNAGISTTGGKKPDTTYTDPACATGDTRDRENQGLLLAKTGPTGNYAAGVADIKGLPKNMPLKELGYDIREPGVNNNDPRGSHCGAGAPRFNVTTSADSYFIGCNSPPPNTQTPGNGWLRLRWGTGAAGSVMGYSATSGLLVPVTGNVQNVQIVMDEGQDTGPDNFGLSVLDNIDINGVLVGRGPSAPH